MARKRIWMVGTTLDGKGGIASVLQQYKAAGLLSTDLVHFEPSHANVGPAGRVLPFLRCATKLWSAIALGQVSVVHAHTSYGGSFWRKLLLVLPAVLTGVPAIVHLHAGNFVEYHAKGSAWRRGWMRFLFRRAFRVVVLSAQWQQWVLQVEPITRTTVIPNSLAASTGARVGELDQNNPTILFLGRIGDAKGTFDLLHAFRTVRETVLHARLVIGGDGDIDRLNRETAALGLKGAVEYVGWVEGVAKAKLFAASWVFALPSYKEGLPVGILEAMAYSRAVIATPVGGVPHAVDHGVTGLLVPAGDLDALAGALLSVLSSPKVALQMGRAARQTFLTKFSHEVNLPKLLALYRDAGAAQVPALHQERVDAT